MGSRKGSAKDRERLEQIREHCLSALEYSEAFEFVSKMDIDVRIKTSLSKMSYDGTLMRLSQIGEDANHLSPAFRDATHHEVPWDQIRGLRNIIVHDYRGVDYSSIDEIVDTELGSLLDFCAKELERSTLEQGGASKQALEREIRALGLVEDPIIHLRPRTDGQTYEGPILHVDEERGYIVQLHGKKSLYVHQLERLSETPETGKSVKISYPEDQTQKATVETVERQRAGA